MENGFKNVYDGTFATYDEYQKFESEEQRKYETIREETKNRVLKEVEEIDLVAEKLGEKLEGKVVTIYEDRSMEDVREEVLGLLNNSFYYS